MLLSGVAFALGWLCFFVIDSLPLIYVSRVVSGVGVGMLFSVSPLYIGEIAHPKIRGALIALTMQGFLVGTLCGSIMGKYLNMWVFAAISLALSIIFLISFSVMPQTPHHLIRCHKVEEAAKSILFYDKRAHVKKELDTLQAFHQANQSTTFISILHELNTPINRRALLMVSIIGILTQISGSYVFSSYMEIILANAHVDIIEPSSLVIIVSLISILSSFLGMLTYDKYGRTIMLFSSSIGAAFAIFLMGLNYLLLDLNFRNPNLQWLSIVSMILYKIAGSFGLTVVPSALASEVFAPSVKGVGSCIRSSLIGISAFLATKFYQPLVNILTEKYLFFTYSLLLILTALYTIFFIPETKGKSLPEIQEILNQRVKAKSHDNKASNNCNIERDCRRDQD